MRGSRTVPRTDGRGGTPTSTLVATNAPDSHLSILVPSPGDLPQFPLTFQAGNAGAQRRARERSIGKLHLGQHRIAPSMRYRSPPRRTSVWIDVFAEASSCPSTAAPRTSSIGTRFRGLYSQTAGLIPKGSLSSYFLGDNGQHTSPTTWATVQEGNRTPRDIAHSLGT